MAKKSDRRSRRAPPKSNRRKKKTIRARRTKRIIRGMKSKDIHHFMEGLLSDDLHAKRVLSLADATTGVIHAAAASIHAIGQGLAAAKGLNPKHAVKQIDRLLSNSGIDVWTLF